MNIIRYGCVNMTDWFRRSGTDYGFVKISKCLITITVHVNIEQILTSHIFQQKLQSKVIGHKILRIKTSPAVIFKIILNLILINILLITHVQ